MSQFSKKFYPGLQSLKMLKVLVFDISNLKHYGSLCYESSNIVEQFPVNFYTVNPYIVFLSISSNMFFLAGQKRIPSFVFALKKEGFTILFYI